MHFQKHYGRNSSMRLKFIVGLFSIRTLLWGSMAFALDITGPFQITFDTTWSLDESPITVTGGLVEILEDSVLTLSAGVLVQFDANSGILVTKGELQIEGTSVKHAVLSATANSENWIGIQFEEGASAAVYEVDSKNWKNAQYVNGSKIEYADIINAGSDTSYIYALQIKQSAPYLHNVQFIECPRLVFVDSLLGYFVSNNINFARSGTPEENYYNKYIIFLVDGDRSTISNNYMIIKNFTSINATQGKSNLEVIYSRHLAGLYISNSDLIGNIDLQEIGTVILEENKCKGFRVANYDLFNSLPPTSQRQFIINKNMFDNLFQVVRDSSPMMSFITNNTFLGGFYFNAYDTNSTVANNTIQNWFEYNNGLWNNFLMENNTIENCTKGLFFSGPGNWNVVRNIIRHSSTTNSAFLNLKLRNGALASTATFTKNKVQNVTADVLINVVQYKTDNDGWVVERNLFHANTVNYLIMITKELIYDEHPVDRRIRMPGNYWGESLHDIMEKRQTVLDGLKTREHPIVVFETALTEPLFDGLLVEINLPSSLFMSDGSIGGVLDHGTFVLQAGEYVSDLSLIVTGNATLIINPGVNVTFNDTGIFAGRNGTLSMLGVPENRIVLASANSNYWLGVILDSNLFSRISYTLFYRMRSFDHTGLGGFELEYVEFVGSYNPFKSYDIGSSLVESNDPETISFKNCTFSGGFGGIRIESRFMNIVFANCTFKYTHGIYIGGVKGDVLLVDSLVHDSDWGLYSKFFENWETSYIVANNTFYDNRADIMIKWISPSSLFLSENQFLGGQSAIEISASKADSILIEKNLIKSYSGGSVADIFYSASSKSTSGLNMTENIFSDCRAEHILELEYESSQRLTNIGNIFTGELEPTSSSEAAIFFIKQWPKSFATMNGNIFAIPYLGMPYVRVEADEVAIIDASASFWNTDDEEVAMERIYYESSDSSRLHLQPMLNSSGLPIDNSTICNHVVLDLDIPAASVPFSGLFIGGTIIFIQNLHFCLDSPQIDVYCKFSGLSIGDRIHLAVFAREKVIGCQTPYSGRPGAIAVYFTSHDNRNGDFLPSDAKWASTNDDFQYTESAKSVTVGNFSSFVEAETSIDITWDNDGLRSLVTNVNQLETTFEGNDVLVAVECLVFNDDSGTFQKAQTFEIGDIDEGVNRTEIILSSDILIPYSVVQGNRDWVLVIINVPAYIESEDEYVILGQQISEIIAVSIYTKNEQNRLQDGCTSVEPCPELLEELREELPCPPNFMFAEIDDRFESDSACSWPPEPFNPVHAFNCKLFHDGAGGCFRGTASNGAGQQCCYSEVGPLIEKADDGAGTEDCVSAQVDVPGHFKKDVIPYIDCCVWPFGSQAQCEEYYEERPPSDSKEYRLPPRANGWGDPHIRTLDGYEYDFNGAGEYIALCGLLDNSGDITEIINVCIPSNERLLHNDNVVSIHFLFEAFGADLLGTVTVGVGIIDPTHKNGESSIVVITHGTNRVNIYDGDKIVSFPPIGGNPKTLTAYLTTGVIIKRSADLTTEDEIVVQIKFPSGLQVTISEFSGIMLSSVSYVNGLSSLQSVGLYGFPDGNPNNDLIDSFGAEVDVSDISGYNSVSEKIFHEFGRSWMIEKSTSSVFQVVEDINFEQYHKPDFVPVFETPEMSSELQAQADIACGNIELESTRNSCYFDIAVTKEVEIISSISAVVKKEEFIVIAKSNNSPEIQGQRDQVADVIFGESVMFKFVATDIDNDRLVAFLQRNDMNAFVLQNINNTTNGTIEVDLFFDEIYKDGLYHAQVILSDNISPIICTAKVSVTNSDLSTNPSITSNPTKEVSSNPSVEVLPSPNIMPSINPTKSSKPTTLKSSIPSTETSEPSNLICALIAPLREIFILDLLLGVFFDLFGC